MRAAIQEAKKALLHDDVPIGAVVVKDGVIIARAHNKKEKKGNAVCHAEIEALTKAAKKMKNWYLEGAELYVTLEPCAMCAGAMVNARIEKLYFGAYDMRFGCAGSVLNLTEEPHFNHRVKTEGGILKEECAALLTAFFKEKRNKKNTAEE